MHCRSIAYSTVTIVISVQLTLDGVHCHLRDSVKQQPLPVPPILPPLCAFQGFILLIHINAVLSNQSMIAAGNFV